MKKIMVTGFPHCGTTILRKIIGNHPDIMDVPKESRAISSALISKAKQLNKKGVVIKEPFVLRLGGNIRQMQAKMTGYKVVLIMRDPADIISSMNMRFNNDIPANHNFDKWEQYARVYLNPKSNFCYKLKYEEMFENNFAKLKDLFRWLDLEWTDDVIHTNEQRVTKHNRGVMFSQGNVPPRNHSDNFRTWQVNQKIEPQIGVNRDKLDEENKRRIQNSEVAKTLGYHV